MKTIGAVMLAAVLSAAGVARAAPSVAAAPATTELAREADAFFKGNQPGGVVLVTRGDTVLLRRAYGMADIENGLAMQPDAALRLASMSKQFTAVAVLLLVQAGKLSLDATVVSLDPALTGPLAQVTVRQLLTHTSGKARDLFARQLRVHQDERADVVERVEGEVRADMAEQPLQLRLLERQAQVVLVACGLGQARLPADRQIQQAPGDIGGKQQGCAGDHRLRVVQRHRRRRQVAQQPQHAVHGEIDADRHRQAADEQQSQPAQLAIPIGLQPSIQPAQYQAAQQAADAQTDHCSKLERVGHPFFALPRQVGDRQEQRPSQGLHQPEHASYPAHACRLPASIKRVRSVGAQADHPCCRLAHSIGRRGMQCITPAETVSLSGVVLHLRKALRADVLEAAGWCVACLIVGCRPAPYRWRRRIRRSHRLTAFPPRGNERTS